MKSRYVSPESLHEIFKEFLLQKNVVFVFSTDVVKNSWMEWIVTNSQMSGTCAVSEENFMAWDTFKSLFSDDSVEGKTTIPALLRKLFVRDLIKKNSQKHFFKKIIAPQFSNEAVSFTNWISSILPSLKLWHGRFVKQSEHDDEDDDFLFLYEQYKNFLDKNNFYEPSWVTPDFKRGAKKVILFYPEILEDYSEYEKIFEESEFILPIKLPPQNGAGPKCYRYADSRKELRRTILQMKNLVEQKKCQWTDIALSVPNLDVYRPYLERELKKYYVPFVIRAGIPLTVNNAGSIFSDINDCYQNDFSYDSVRGILLNELVPWKKSLAVTKDNLLRAGCEMRCICSYTTEEQNKKIKHDVFEQALSATANCNEAELNFYKQFKKDITAICTANSFYGVRQAWFEFRANFIEDGNFSAEANKILSRCVTTLNELIQIEQTLFEKTGVQIENPFDFFLTELQSKTYTMQNKTAGLSVYPYKLTAEAYFKYQFVIDASQKNLEVLYKPLSFLNECKRERLNLIEDEKKYNASQAFMRLYAKNNQDGIVQFSYAENTFDGFAIAHNFLDVVDDDEPLLSLDENDFILSESKWFLNGGKEDSFLFTDEQKKQFEFWSELNQVNTDEASRAIQSCINQIKQNRIQKGQLATDKMVITQKDLRSFFPCQRNWIFSNVLGLSETSLDTQLFSPFDEGTINHEIIERFLKHCIEKNNSKLPVTNLNGTFNDEQKIFELLLTFADAAINENIREDYAKSPLAKVVLNAAQKNIAQNILGFLHSFCLPFENGGFGNFSITCVEQWFNDEENEWMYSGKVDCILNDGEEFYIVDFKTGNTPSKESCIVTNKGVLQDFQIPLYMQMWNKNHPGQEMENALFYSIKKQKPSFVVSSKPRRQEKTCTAQAYISTLDALNNYAAEFCKKLQEADFTPSASGEDLYNSIDVYDFCTSCAFKNICRTLFTISGRTLEK